MAKSIPTLYREWQARQKSVLRLDASWRRSLVAGRYTEAEGTLERKRVAERMQDTAAAKISKSVADSKGRWRWDGENPPVDLLKGKRQR